MHVPKNRNEVVSSARVRQRTINRKVFQGAKNSNGDDDTRVQNVSRDELGRLRARAKNNEKEGSLELRMRTDGASTVHEA